MPRNGAMPSFELVQQPLRFLLRQPASNHRLWYLLGGFAIKLMAFGESAFVQPPPSRLIIVPAFLVLF